MIAIGSRVAFNYSGDVATGTVTHITTSGEFHITRDPEYHGHNPLSKVKRERSVLVIFENNQVTDLIHKRQITEAERREMVVLLDKHTKSQDLLRLKLTAIIEKIGDAWDLDEVKMYLEDMFGKDIFEDSYREELIGEKT